ncbi:MAG TPA: porin [Steroidobacteraceae bacterium]|jgi:opacity protein-like surface antigen|nr:porin [Steroidobacteraceae bacterium]
MQSRLTRLLPCIALLCAAGARAQDSELPRYSFNGFGTLGVVHSTEDLADFTGSDARPNGAGYTRDWAAGVDSLIGAQLDVVFTSRLSAVVQVMSEQNYDDTYRPHVEWANVKYQFTPDFSVRVGRTVLLVFRLSDTRKVGFTYPWVRPPLDLYGLSPISTTDGADASYRLHAGDWTHTLQLRVGANDTKLPNSGGTVSSRDIWELSDSVEFGALSAHIAYVKTDVTVPSFNVLFDGFRQFGPQGVAIAEQNEVRSAATSFVGIGASFDPGDWFVMGEWGRFDSDSVLGVKTAWYLGGGYRFAKLTPYVTYSRADADKLSDPGLDVSTLPPQLAAPALGLNAALNDILSQNVIETTVSAGMRWDFMRNFDLKLQFDHVSVGKGSTGILNNARPGYQLGGAFDVFSATIDFVF